MCATLHSPITDPARLDELVRLRLLDTPPEEPFDRLTRLAAQTLQAPVALLSLVDNRRQFFKSSFGLPEPWRTRRETPLSHSFCQHVVSRAVPLVVQDARDHPLLRNNPAVAELNVVAYLGVPLTTPTGRTLGSFCVAAPRPIPWSSKDQATLGDLAAAAMSEIALRCAHDEVLAANQRLTQEAAAREAALLELASSEARLQAAQRLAHVGSFELSTRHRANAHWSAEAHRIMAHSSEPPPSTIDGFLERIVHPDDRERMAAAIDAAISQRQAVEVEYRAQFSDASTRSLATVIEPMPEPDKNGPIVMCTALDVTARNEAAAAITEQRGQLLHVARVATAGEMAAVMAHEINQPLAAISHTATACERLLRSKRLNSEELRQHLADIARQAKRASEIIRRIGSFVQKKPSRITRLELGRVISDVVNLLAPLCWRHRIKITRVEPDKPLFVWWDEIQLVQLLANLVRNAIDAVAANPSDNRRVEIAARMIDEGEAVLTISDSGSGVAEEMRERIFEPFFSTRADGLGMGLAIARTIAEAHDAKLTIEPAQGTEWSTVFLLRMLAEAPELD